MNYGKNNGGYWDLPGVYQPSRAINKGANIQVWNLDPHHDRQYTLVKSSINGYYEIQVGYTTNSRVDIQGGGTGNGTSVKIWDKNGQNNQMFLFHHLGNGRFKIYDKNSGKILCLKGRSNKNGTNVHIWSDHNGASVEWYLIDVKTKKAFVPKPVSKTPDFFINNKAFKYETASMVSRSEGRATVESVNGNKIILRVVGTSHNSDVPPGYPKESDFDRKMEISFENGSYLYMPDVFPKGEISDDGITLSFSGPGHISLTVDN